MHALRWRGASWLAAGLTLGLLGGCQSLGSPEPIAGGARNLPAECRWPASGEGLERLRATQDALQARGYEVLDTDAKLGLVSAERKTRQPGIGALNSPFGRSGFWGGFGLGGSHGFSLGTSHRFGGPYNTDPIQVERISVTTPADTTYVGRDSVVVDRDGYLIDARSYNLPSVCRELRQEIDSRMRADIGAAGDVDRGDGL